MYFLSSQPFLKTWCRTPNRNGDVGARADPHVLVGLGRGAREARVDDDHLGSRFPWRAACAASRPGAPRRRSSRCTARTWCCACRCTSSSSRRSPTCSRRPRPWWSGRCAPGGRSCCCPTGSSTCAAGRPARCCASTSRRRRPSRGRSASSSSSILALISFSAWSHEIFSYLLPTSFIGVFSR